MLIYQVYSYNPAWDNEDAFHSSPDADTGLFNPAPHMFFKL